MNKNSFSIAVHGGAGVISKELDPSEYYNSLKLVVKGAVEYAESKLADDSVKAVDVAEFAVRLLENDLQFNAGRGSVFTTAGTHEMEASIMEGKTRRSGAVSMLPDVKNPVSVARMVMDHTHHRYLCGESAVALADTHGAERAPMEYFHSDRRFAQLEAARNTSGVFNDHDLAAAAQWGFSSSGGGAADATDKSKSDETGTVGAVCFYKGSCAAATSTGGMTNKMCGRIGDSPIIGAGTWADDATCAASCTGRGESFMEYVTAYDVAARMKYAKQSLKDAVHDALHGENAMPANAGGLVAVDGKTGEIVMDYNSLGMMRGWCTVTIEMKTPRSSDGMDHMESKKAMRIDRQGGVALWEEVVELFQ